MVETTSNPEPIAGSNSAPSDESLKAALAESRANLAPPPESAPRRKRGRPSNAEKAARGETPTPARETPAAEGATLHRIGPEPGRPQGPPIPPSLLKPVLQLPFQAAAAKTGFEGFRLSKHEADDLVPLADEVIRTYMPQVSGEQAVLATFLVTVGGMSLMKYIAYQEWKEAQAKHAESTQAAQPAANPPTPIRTPPPPPMGLRRADRASGVGAPGPVVNGQFFPTETR